MSMPAERMNRRHNLRSVLEGMAEAPDLAVNDLSDDSRRLGQGDVFVACAGATRHGLEFANEALDAGAAAVLWDTSTGDPARARGRVPFIGVADLAARLGDLANRWYDSPSKSLDVVGVTGTNGKTTVAWLTAQGLQLQGLPAGYVGTLGFGVDELSVDLGLTTPPCLDLQRKLAGFRDAGARAAAIEVSSHALSQKRLDGVTLHAAVFTNLSRDHIDYHGDMRAYGASKAKLFREFDSEHRIVGLDSAFGRELAASLDTRVVTTSTEPDRRLDGCRFLFVRSSAATGSGSRVKVDSSWGSGELHVPLPGGFNVANAIQVFALLLLRGAEFESAAETIAALSAPPGRLELVNGPQDRDQPRVYVDYAHTPAALDAVLRALRPHAAGRIWCVFGCGGDRDRGKRPEMGEVASRLAERVVLTNDNPRSESPAAILGEIEAGLRGSAEVIEDRASAIAWTIAQAGADDTVLIAGKGHENYQIIGDRRLDFSDSAAARANLAVRRRQRGDDAR